MRVPGLGRWPASCVVFLAATSFLGASPLDVSALATISLRGRPQTVHVYGTRGHGDPVIVSSGDGGWLHLGPQVAELLAAKGFFVVGFDVKAYLASFTVGPTTLRAEDEPADYRVLVSYAGQGSTKKPILIGVSEGAGLSVLAATDPATRQAIAGVIALGLPRVNELGWRWKDSLIYITHGVPREPIFSTASVVERLASTPLATIQSDHDEFASVEEIQQILESAHVPKRLWVVTSTDHRFSGNLAEFHLRLLEAVDWVKQQALSSS